VVFGTEKLTQPDERGIKGKPMRMKSKGWVNIAQRYAYSACVQRGASRARCGRKEEMKLSHLSVTAVKAVPNNIKIILCLREQKLASHNFYMYD
jgi:hypothetical protein